MQGSGVRVQGSGFRTQGPQSGLHFPHFEPRGVSLPHGTQEGFAERAKDSSFACRASVSRFGFGARFRAKWGNLKRLHGLLPESQDQSLSLTVLYVPYSLDSGRGQGSGFQVYERAVLLPE